MIIREEIEIDAPLGIVWEIFSCIEKWEEWNTVCKGCCFVAGSEMAPGTCLSFAISPFIFPVRISPRIVSCIPEREVVWEGARLGIHAVHGFKFREENGRVILCSIEEFHGALTSLSRLLFLPARLHRLTRELLSAIKLEAESRYRAKGYSES